MNHNSSQYLSDLHEQIHTQTEEIASLRQQLANAERLTKVVLAATSQLDTQQVFTLICTELAHAFQVPQVALAVIQEGESYLKVVAEYCEPGRTSALDAIIPLTNNPTTEYVVMYRQPLIIDNTQNEELLPPDVRDLLQRRHTVSMMIMPVTVEDTVVGTIGIDSVEERVFTEQEVALAGQMSEAISVAVRNAQLHAAVQRELAERSKAEEIIVTQAATLAELSTPLIPLTNNVLVCPLIGSVDEARAQQITETLLFGVSNKQVHTIIIDITGVSFVDTYLASSLIQTASALQLLGATTVLTGIRPEIAQTIVGLGIELRGVVTFATLQDGIKYAMRKSAR